MDGIALNIGLVVLFVLIGGYFSASELALVSLRDSQVARLAAQSRRGGRVARLREDPNRFLASVQIGVTLAGFFSAACGGSTEKSPPEEGLLDGLLHRDEVRDRTGFEVPEGEFSTLGGYVQETLGQVPIVGDRVPLHDAELVVTEMDGHRVATVRLERGA